MRVNADAVRSAPDLFNDFTYFLVDPVHSDQFHQQDRRWVFGGSVSQTVTHALFGLPGETEFGLQTRYGTSASPSAASSSALPARL